MRFPRYMLATLIATLALVASAQAKQIPAPPVVHLVQLSWSATYRKCGGAEGCTDPDTRTIYIARGIDRFALQYELGHLFDSEVLTPLDRAILMRRMGVRGPWVKFDRVGRYLIERTGSACVQASDCPDETFASAYASCRLHEIPGLGGTIWEAPSWYPTKARERSVCRTIVNAFYY